MNSENISTSSGSDEISLKELILKTGEWLKYLLSKWLIILIIAIVGMILGYCYADRKKPVYTASTTFVIEEENSGNNGLAGLGGLASMVGISSSSGGLFQGDNILELYKSRKMIEKALLTDVSYGESRKVLIDYYIDFNSLKKSWEQKPELLNISFVNKELKPVQERLRDSVMGAICGDIEKNYLSVMKPDKALNIIKADVKSSDEFFAKAFNEVIVNTVNDFYLKTKTKKSLENVLILQQKTDSIKAVMDGAIYRAAAVTDATPNLNPTRQVQRLVPVQRSQFSAEMNKNILGSLIQNLEMAKIALRKDAPLIQVIDEPIFPLKVEKLGNLKGAILGGMIAGFCIVMVLIGRRIVKNSLS